MERKIQVLIPASYDFVISKILDWENEEGHVTLTHAPDGSGDWLAIGPKSKVESLVDDITLDDEESIELIMGSAIVVD